MSGPHEIQAYLSLGGNLGDPFKAMASSLRMIDAEPSSRVVAASSVYRTPPWGDVRQPHFLNAAAEIRTSLGARALLDFCLGIETALKRIRTEPGGPRSIDVDVLLYGDHAYREPGMEIPHPRMLLRAFVLAPLAEIAPGLKLAGTPIEDHLGAVDQTGITIVASGGDWWRENATATAR